MKPTSANSKNSFKLYIVRTGITTTTTTTTTTANITTNTTTEPVPVAARSKAQVYGRASAEIVGSNPTGSMDVCLL